MNYILLASLAGMIIGLSGCDLENGQPSPTGQVRQLWPTGTNPLPSPVDSRLLFTQEIQPSGLYMLENGTATHLNALGPVARTDYSWSVDGLRIAISAPGQPGDASAGIWISGPGDYSTWNRIWDRGSHPRFFPMESLLVCAGPEDGSGDQGIWLLDFSGGQRQRVVPLGVAPEVSPDGLRIAYLVTTGGSAGRTMIVYNRQNQDRDTVAVHVLRHAWLSDSRTLVYETVQNGGPEINTVGPSDGLLGVTVASGTSPAAMRVDNGFLYSGISGDRLSGIFHAAVAVAPVRIAAHGINARDAGANRVVAQDSTVLIEITF